MVSKTPPLEMMRSEDRQRMEEKADEVDEDRQPSRNGVAQSAADMKPASDGFRYDTTKVFGIDLLVRFRSFTARDFEKFAMEADKNILLYSICDSDGKLMYDAETLDAELDIWDARTYMQLLSFANLHCLGRGGLDDMVEESVGN